MKIQRSNQGVKLWLSANDTYNWAHKAGSSWPCSTLSNKRLFAEFDGSGDLIDLSVNGRTALNVDGNEFNAIVADFVPTGPIVLNV